MCLFLPTLARTSYHTLTLRPAQTLSTTPRALLIAHLLFIICNINRLKEKDGNSRPPLIIPFSLLVDMSQINARFRSIEGNLGIEWLVIEPCDH